MEALEGKRLLKLMWLPEPKSMIWDMKDESPVGESSISVVLDSKGAEIASWAQRFEVLYRRWLADQSSEVFDVDHNVNEQALSIVRNLNARNSRFAFFYWFDVDRSTNENFLWTTSPLSGIDLIDLGPKYHPKNRLVSLSDSIVVPRHDLLNRA